MKKENRYVESLSNIDLNKLWDMSCAVIGRPVIEIYYGLTHKSINWFACLIPGLIFNILLLTRLDAPLFRFLRMGGVFPPSGVWSYFLYSFGGAMIGFIAWGLWQTYLHNRVTWRLTEVFQNSGLKNSTGKLPTFIFDKPLDEYTRRMRLSRACLPESQFVAAKESLESAMQVFIDEIKENRECGTVDIVYSSHAIPKVVKFSGLAEVGPDRFVIGETRARKIMVSLDEIPHFLVGGQSGGGKSTFLRQLITTLYLNNKTYKFVLMDLKDGLEFQLFNRLERVSVADKVSTAIHYLTKLERQLKSRMEFLKAVECKDITAFLEKPLERRKELELQHNKGELFSRTIVVIDEAAALFMAGDKAQAKQVQKAKAHTILLAAQGRAVGIHIIIATQRPEVRAVDGQIKGNLSGAIAFQMPNHASSMTILDNGRAAQLSQIKGRAIWKSGLEMVELQTPYLTVEDASELLKPYKIQNTKPGDKSESDKIDESQVTDTEDNIEEVPDEVEQ